jgi:glycosyltransferase involved in cell wall biosynthesis
VTRTVCFVVPDSVDDPARPSGGNLYDRRVRTELEDLGWSVVMRTVAGAWPSPTPAEVAGLAAPLDRAVDGESVLIDGLVASAAPELVSRYAARLRIAVLVHLPLGVLTPGRRDSEASLLRSVAAVVTTSGWTRSWLITEYGLAGDAVTVAVPGTDLGEPATGTASGGALLCVGAVTPVKGHDLLVEALAALDAPGWRCTCVGSLGADPAFVRAVEDRAREAGVSDRLVLAGPLHGADLEAAYRDADVLVLPSRAETYGMVVTEALAHGIPVIASRIGGVPEALDVAADGTLPGVLVPVGDAHALASALRGWLTDAELRERLRRAARDRRGRLATWRDTARRIGDALSPS